MKHLTLIILIMLAGGIHLHAQDEDSHDENESIFIDTTYQEDYDESYDGEQQDMTHTLVEPETLEGTSEYKAEKIDLKKFDEAKWKEVTGSTSYDEEKPEPLPEMDLPQVQPWSGAILRIIAYIAIIAIVIFLIYYVVKNTTLSNQPKITPLADEGVHKNVENIEELDVQALLQQAIAHGNLKLAIRLYYLDLLKRLNATGVIEWKKDKTNRDYLAELFNRSYFYDEIRKLTLGYEVVWYGEHDIPSTSLQSLINQFEILSEKIKTTDQS